MKKEYFIMGSIEAVLGLLVLCTTSVLKELMPRIGYAAFQSAAAGSYTYGSYEMSFGLANTISIVLIIAGAVQILLSLRKQKNMKEDSEWKKRFPNLLMEW